MCLPLNMYCNMLFRIVVHFPVVFLDGFRNTHWLCVEYTARCEGESKIIRSVATYCALLVGHDTIPVVYLSPKAVVQM
jgi:hypothetical protein